MTLDGPNTLQGLLNCQRIPASETGVMPKMNAQSPGSMTAHDKIEFDANTDAQYLRVMECHVVWLHGVQQAL